MKKEKKEVLIYVVFLLTMFLTIINKKNFHVDEIYSYTLANNVNSIAIDFEEGRTYEPAEDIYLANMIVNDTNEAFNFANVWKNQKNDVHPPLYYLILHIICSFNAGRFSTWHAAVVNIAFALLTLHILRKLIYLYVEDSITVNLGSVLFIVSAGILHSVSFFRMYVMAMFWVTYMAYLFVKAFQERTERKTWVWIGFAATAGALTHYYCIIYLCATCLIFGICLLIEKRWKDVALLIASMMAAGSISVAVFPAMLQHMFSGYRGKESMANLSGTWAEHWERIKSFYGIINTQMLGKTGSAGIVFAFLVVLVLAVLWKECDVKPIKFNRKNFMKWMIIVIPAVIYFLFVSLSAVYITDRYIFPIYAVVFCMFVCMLAVLWTRLTTIKNAYIIMCLIGSLLIVNGFANIGWSYLYKSSSEFLSRAQEYSDRNCISVYDAKWKEQPSYCEVKNYKSITFISQENRNNILQYENLFQDGFMLNIIGGGVMRKLSG